MEGVKEVRGSWERTNLSLEPHVDLAYIELHKDLGQSQPGSHRRVLRLFRIYLLDDYDRGVPAIYSDGF